jgi:gliding motility-associated-like protein
LYKYIIISIFFSSSVFSQNLVPDPGFELQTDTNLIGCFGGIDTATLQSSQNFFRYPKNLQYWHSPAYALSGYSHNNCTKLKEAWGVQAPLEGLAKAKITVYAYGYAPQVPGSERKNVRSYLQTQLISKLKKNTKYKVSFYVSPTFTLRDTTDTFYYASSNIAALLSVDRPTAFNNPNVDTNVVIHRNPQVKNHPDSILDDTSKWYRVCGIFQAEGGEEWLTIGNFLSDSNTTLKVLTTPSDSGIFFKHSWYYIDYVTVEAINNINPSAGHDTLICDTNAFTKTLTARSGANFYNWSTGDTTESITVDSIGTYWLETDYGCGVESDTLKIILQDSLSLQLGADTTLCETVDSIQISAPLGFNQYRWNTGDSTTSIWAKQSGIYTLEAAYLCDTLQDSIKVTFNPKPPPPLVSDTGFCLGDTVQLNAQGQNLLWHDSIQDQSPKTSPPWLYNSSVGTKQFWVSQSINNCESDLAQFTVKTEKPTSVLLGSDTILCGADSLEIGQATDSSWKYLWNTGDTTSKVNAKNSGEYWLQASNLCNTSSDTVQVNFNPIPSPPLVQNLTYCDTVSLNIDSLKISGQNLLWYKSINDSLGKTNAPIPQALEAGTYRFFVSQTINSCESEIATFELTVLSKPKLALIQNKTLCEGEVIKLDAYFPTATYQWSTGDTTASITIDSSGVYAVSLSNQCGIAQDSVHLDFENCETKIFVPNVFSPNGDGINDIFQPEGENFQLTQMQIYNRWGEQIYRSNIPYWDGRIKGKKAQTGVYFYLISYYDAIGEQKQLKGTVSLVY